MTTRKPTISQRIDAVVAATRIADMMQDRPRQSQLPRCDEPWMIIGGLRETDVSRRLIRKWLDAIAAAEFTPHWKRCWVLLHVAEIELAIGLDHDPRSAQALAAKRGDGASWKAFCFPAPPATQSICAAIEQELANA